MDNISKILSDRSIQPPEDLNLLKDYLDTKYGKNVKIRIKNRGFVLEANNAALANALRYEIRYIQRNITNKKITINIV